jgi:uncharacterized membrane protein
MKKVLFVIFLVLVGCSAQKEVITTIKPVMVVPPVIEDSLKASVITDTVIIANTVYKKDTLTTVKYYPKEKKFYIKVKPDTLRFFDTVKTVIVKEEKKENSDKAYIFYGLSAIIILVIVYKIFK